LQKRDLLNTDEMRTRHARGEFRTTAPFAVRPPRPLGRDIVAAITKMQERDGIAARLPGIDCGACGAPTCTAFAEDVVGGEAAQADCVFVRQNQLEARLAQRPAPGAAARRRDTVDRRSDDDRH
jgi:hypothetical protein